jgi:peptide/nickel transport system substrate-binding protein
MSVWGGLTNGVPGPDSSPGELVPNSRIDLHWPSWGLYEETSGAMGRQADLPPVQDLLKLNKAWLAAADSTEREVIWHDILKLHADQAFTLGIVSGVRQPVIVANKLRNLPQEGLYNWDPGALFGIYNPDTFWFDD